MSKFPSNVSANRQSLYLLPDEKADLERIGQMLHALGYPGVLGTKGANRTQVVREMIKYVKANPPPKFKG